MEHQAKACLRQLTATIALIVCGIAMGCGHQQQPNGDQKKVDPVSETAPKFEPLRHEAPIVANVTPVASVGECAPKYANGLHGSCINNQPCRGIGVVGEGGKAECRCYAKAGGCDEKQRCDAIKKACVPEDEPGFGRAGDD